MAFKLTYFLLEEIGQLEWLKPVQKAKLLKLCRLMSADSETSV
jgi:hypothetical protein